MFGKNFEEMFGKELLKKFTGELPQMHANIEIVSHCGVTQMVRIDGDRVSVEAALLDLTDMVATAKGMSAAQFAQEQLNIFKMRDAIKSNNEAAFDNALQSYINNLFKDDK